MKDVYKRQKESFGGLEYSKAFIEKWKGDSLITPGIAPHAPYTNSDESLISAYKLSKEYDVCLLYTSSKKSASCRRWCNG